MTTRQRIHLKRHIKRWATTNPPELARQLRELEDALADAFTQAGNIANGSDEVRGALVAADDVDAYVETAYPVAEELVEVPLVLTDSVGMGQPLNYRLQNTSGKTVKGRVFAKVGVDAYANNTLVLQIRKNGTSVLARVRVDSTVDGANSTEELVARSEHHIEPPTDITLANGDTLSVFHDGSEGDTATDQAGYTVRNMFLSFKGNPL